MNHRLVIGLFISGALAVSAGLAQGQDAPPPHGGPRGDRMGPPMGDRVELMGFEGTRGGKVVTGAPFSGVAVTESTQTLADGNHITRKTQSNVFRDGQGRVRREVTLSGFGPVAASGTPKSFVVINDPVAKTNTVLHPDTKVAETMPHAGHGMRGGPKASSNEGRWQAREEKEVAAGVLKKEDLGTQTIAGVAAQGTRYTRTIPAGQMGNEKPITIVNERWYSNDLQMVVMSKRTNPMGGVTTYTLTNIQRTEPSSSLFTVPSDYTPRAPHGFARRGGQVPQGTPPPPAEN
jgi:hypothetical protein